jgi:hypothetical protein
MDTPRPAANKSPGRGRKAFADERGVIVSWLLRLALWFLIVAIALFDIGAVAVNYFGLDSRADDIAIAVATDVADGSVSGPTAIQEDAAALAAASGARLLGARLDARGVLHVRVRRRANTFVLGRFGAFRKIVTATAKASSGTR